MQILVRTACSGVEHDFDLEIEPSMTIKQVKKCLHDQIKKLTGNTVTDDNLKAGYFLFDGDMLDRDEDSIGLYGIEENSALEYIPPINGISRFNSAILKFVDISNDKGLKRVAWNKNAPEWRRVYHGLVFEGICKNPRCKAKGKMVCISMHYQRWDLKSYEDLEKSVCPLCKEYVEPKTCAFNNCWWRFEGAKIVQEDKLPVKCPQTSWKQADDAYHYFDEDASGTIRWYALTIEVVKTKPSS